MPEVRSIRPSTGFEASSFRGQPCHPCAKVDSASLLRRHIANDGVNSTLLTESKSCFTRKAALRRWVLREILLVRKMVLLRWRPLGATTKGKCAGRMKCSKYGQSCDTETTSIRLVSDYLSMDRSRAVSELRPFLLGLVRSIVDEPEMVILEPRTSGNRTVFHLHVAESDTSKIIGENLRAFSHLLTTDASKYGEILVHKVERGIHLVPKSMPTRFAAMSRPGSSLAQELL